MPSEIGRVREEEEEGGGGGGVGVCVSWSFARQEMAFVGASARARVHGRNPRLPPYPTGLPNFPNTPLPPPRKTSGLMG